MAVDLEGRVIRSVNIGNKAFISRWKDLPGNVQDEALRVIQSLMGLPFDRVPRKLHMHQLVGKDVPSVLNPNNKERAWTLHITADDRYKASFTFEGECCHFRACGLHDEIDKKP